MGVETIAVGTIDEAIGVLDRFDGTVLVLRPHAAGDEVSDLPARVVLHASTLEAVRSLVGRRLILQCASSLRDGGLSAEEIAAAVVTVGRQQLEGFSLSLPLEHVAKMRQISEIGGWIDRLLLTGLDHLCVYVNHVSDSDLAVLRHRYPSVDIRTRVGTSLWLGDPRSLTITGTVIASESVRRGQRFGYRQHVARTDLEIVTVVGGTTHGVGLQAPKAVHGSERAKTVYRAAMAAINRNMSPFSWDGRRLRFAEPPHMAVSMLVVPKGISAPRVGDRVPAKLRYTTTRFDRVGIA
jgi:hypothetical protein